MILRHPWDSIEDYITIEFSAWIMFCTDGWKIDTNDHYPVNLPRNWLFLHYRFP